MEVIQIEEQKEQRIKKNENSFINMRDNIKHGNIWIKKEQEEVIIDEQKKF